MKDVICFFFFFFHLLLNRYKIIINFGSEQFKQFCLLIKKGSKSVNNSVVRLDEFYCYTFISKGNIKSQ